MNIDSICHTCARRDCPDLYWINREYIERKHIGITITKCPLYVYGTPDQPKDDGKKEWA